MAISADGRTIAVAGGTFATRGRLAVLVYKECACSEGWLLAAELPSLRAFPNFEVFDTDHFGESLSLSGDGNVLAVGAPRDPGDLPCDGPFSAGAVYIFAADSSGVWQRRAFLQGRTVVPSDQLGGEVALSADGKVLVAKACGFAANAQGLRRNHRAGATVGPTTPDPGEDTTTCRWGGSGYVFEADAGGTWSHTAAAIAGPGERVVFGDFSLAMSADAQTVALSASSIRPQTPPVERFSRVVVY
jgi:hypothetical protein